MSDDAPKENPSAFVPPVSSFTGPIAELIAQRMLFPPPRLGLLAILDQFEILRVLGGGALEKYCGFDEEESAFLAGEKMEKEAKPRVKRKTKAA